MWLAFTVLRLTGFALKGAARISVFVFFLLVSFGLVFYSEVSRELWRRRCRRQRRGIRKGELSLDMK